MFNSLADRLTPAVRCGLAMLLACVFSVVLAASPAAATVVITQALSPTVISSGVATPVRFTLTMTNNETNAANFTISNDLPFYFGNTIGTPQIRIFPNNSGTPSSTTAPAPTITTLSAAPPQYRLVWTNGGSGFNIASGGRLEVSFTATINTAVSGAYANAVSFTNTSAAFPYVSGDNSGVVTVGQPPSLSVTQSFSPTSVATNTNTTMSLTIVNSGNSSTSGLRIVDTLPTGLTYTLAGSNSNWNGAAIGDPVVAGQDRTWLVGTTTGFTEIPANTTYVLTVVLRSTATAGVYTNSVAVSANNAVGTLTTMATVTVGAASPVTVCMGIASGTGVSCANGSFTTSGNVGYYYGLTVTNPNAFAVVVNRVQITAPTGSNYQNTGTVTHPTGCVGGCFQTVTSIDKSTLTWSNGQFPITLAAGASLTLRPSMYSPLNQGGTYNAFAQVETDRAGTVAIGPTAPLIINSTILSVTKSVITPVSASLPVTGGTVDYEITISNTGTRNVGSGQIIDTLPTGWSFTSTGFTPLRNINGGAFGAFWPGTSGNTITWSDNTIPVGAIVKYQFRVNVPNPQTAGQYPSKVTITDTTLANFGTISSGDVAAVTIGNGVPQLSINKTVSPGAVLAYQNVQYVVTLRNASTATASAVLQQLEDNLPAGFTYQAGTSQYSLDAGATWNAYTDPTVNPYGRPVGTLVWPMAGATLNPGQQYAMRFTVQAGGTPGSYNNTATFSGDRFVAVTTGPTAPVVVGNAPVLTVGKGAANAANTTTTPGTPATLAGAGTVCYTIQLSNGTATAAQGITIIDTLPTGFGYTSGTSMSSTDGVTFTVTGEPTGAVGTTRTWNGPYTIPGNASLWLRFNVTVPATAGTYSNDVTVTATNAASATSGATAIVTVGTAPVMTFPIVTDSSSLTVPRVSPSARNSGQTTTYTYAVRAASAAAQNMQFRAYLPNYIGVVGGTSQVSTTNGASWITVSDPDTTTFTATWPVVLANLPAGTNMLFRFDAAVDSLAITRMYYTELLTFGSNYALQSIGPPPNDPAVATAPFTRIPPLTVTGASAIDLLSFTARADASGVALHWLSGSEHLNLGYAVYRSATPTGPREAVHEGLIGGIGSGTRGGRYDLRDHGVTAGQSVTYWLEDVALGGVRTLHGPVTLTVPTDGSTTAATLPMATIAPQPAGPPATPDSQASAPPAGESVSAVDLRVLSADDQGMIIELHTPELVHTRQDGYSTVRIPGMGTLTRFGVAQIPELVTGFGAPRDVPVQVTVLDAADPVTIAVDPLPVTNSSNDGYGSPSIQPSAIPSTPAPPLTPAPAAVAVPATPARSRATFTPPSAAPDVAGQTRTTLSGSHLQFGFGVLAASGVVPDEQAAIGETAQLRHERLLQLRLYPTRYDAAAGTLTHYRRLRVQVSFAGATQLASPSTTAGTDAWEKAMVLLARDRHLLHRWTAPPIPVADTFVRPTGPACRLTVSQPGMQRVTAAALRAAGLTLTDPTRLYVRFRDQEVPCDVQLAQDEVQAVVFAAERVGSLYSRKSVYQLGESTGPHARMAMVAAPPGDGERITTHLAVVHREEDVFYWANKPADDQPEHWFWTAISPSANDQALHVAAPDRDTHPGLSASLRLGLRAVQFATGDKASVTVSVNHQPIGTLHTTGSGYLDTTLGFDQGLLHGGNGNTVSFHVPDGVTIYLDRFDLAYVAANAGQDGELSGSVAGTTNGTLAVTGVSGEAVVYDVTAAAAPRRITGGVATADGLAVGIPSNGPAWQARIVDPAGYRTPAVAAWAPGEDLHGSTSGADYLILAPAELRPAADRLALHRGVQGLQTRVVDLADVYAEFGGGHAEPEAIRLFLRWAASNWPAPKPVYVVLMGDGHYDYRNDFGTSPGVQVPVVLRDNGAIGTIADENALAAVLGDDALPDVMLGRLPVQTLPEAQTVVDKLVAYDLTSGEPWRQRGVTVADDDDPAFTDLARDVRQDHATTVDWLGLTSHQGPAVRGRLGSGNNLVVYVGHGYTEGWSSEQTFSIWREPDGANDLDAMAADGGAGIWVTANCLNGYFQDPTYPCLGETILRAPGKGAVAFWGTDGYTVPAAQVPMTRRFLKHLTDDQVDLGTATLLSRVGLFLDGGPFWRNELAAWVLLGDPATRLRM
ncbi:MAG: DUF11 domain-containing protein [Candidatus Sericytochromatia bacterium]|nr:DUF11 domain-containing protein [Candidatus Sericytochromatia bacterium]